MRQSLGYCAGSVESRTESWRSGHALRRLFVVMSELPSTCLPIEDIGKISERQKERQKHDEAMVLFSQ